MIRYVNSGSAGPRFSDLVITQYPGNQAQFEIHQPGQDGRAPARANVVLSLLQIQHLRDALTRHLAKHPAPEMFATIIGSDIEPV